jgi:membrane protease YdiL (CAAX protease family)
VRFVAAAKAIAAHRRGRITLAVAAVLLLLAGANVVIKFGPVGTGLVAGPVIALILVFVARLAGLSWDDLGLGRRALRRGAMWAAISVVVVAMVLVAGVAVPWIRSAFFDARYQLDAGSALLTALVVIPVSTILLEEVAFRGVLFGFLHQRRRTAWAFGVSSTLFGLWHILPSLPAARFVTVAAVVGITGLLGLLLCELRRRSGSLLAAVGGHWAANGFGVLLAALLWSSS